LVVYRPGSLLAAPGGKRRFLDMPVRNRKNANTAVHAGARLLLHARLYAALGIALVDSVKQEVKRKLARRKARKWLD
jgi:hypothetical protein